MIQVNALGDACPIPVVKTKNAIKELHGAGIVETLVDNEIAVQNLTKMANQKGYGVKSEKLSEDQFRVTMEIKEGSVSAGEDSAQETQECLVVPEGHKKNVVVAVTASVMGTGDDELGAVLIKGFLYALTETASRMALFGIAASALLMLIFVLMQLHSHKKAVISEAKH